MGMREKLIELLFRCTQKNIKAELHGEKIEVIISQSKIADHLIANDVVPVVRCKDCKYREESPWFDGYRCGNPDEGMASGVVLRDNDFCSYGERKDNVE